MSKPIASILIGSLAALSAPAAAAEPVSTSGGEHWIADFDEAVDLARKENKDLLVDFTGSDWCGWCKKLDKEVFGEQAFLDAAQKDFVLVALDFPHAEEVKAKVPNPERNEELQKQYGIRGFPTILLMNVDGEVYGKTGYRAGGPGPYVEHLTEIRKSGREAMVSTRKLIKAFEAADAAGKQAEWEKVMELFGKLDSDSPFLEQLAGPVRWALQADPKNEKGLKLRAVKALLGSGQADEAVMQSARELDPANKEGLLELAVQAQFSSINSDEEAKAAIQALDALAAKGFKDKKIGFELHFGAAMMCARNLDDAASAKKHAEAAKAIGTDEDRYLKALDEILGS